MDYFNETNFAVTICDKEGIIVYMNEKAKKTFEKYGSGSLIGKSLFDCHNPNSCEKIKELINTSGTNIYTIEKNGGKKMIYQTPWLVDEECKGLVELSLEIPFDMNHFIR